jgi:OOP family OmpA-OmpF porin
MKRIANASGCGFYSNADDLSSASAMADFVERVFLARVDKKMPPPAPAAKKVMDSDYDGVPDDRDKCPDTPLGAKVDEFGCWIIGEVLFGFDKSNVRDKYFEMLDNVIVIMNKNPGMNLSVNGHTDSIGSSRYNNALSMRRAKAVAAYLMKKGISKNRLMINGYGLTRPTASNQTREGRKLNRRVALHPIL